MKYEDKTFKDGDTLMVHPQDGSEPYPVDIKQLVLENLAIGAEMSPADPSPDAPWTEGPVDKIMWNGVNILWGGDKLVWGKEVNENVS